MSRLVVMVPVDRRACGRLSLLARDGRQLFGPVRILATANKVIASKNNNPTRDPRLPFGNAPTGSYRVVGSLPPGYVNPRRPRRFGTTGALVFTAEAGDALAAAANGRRFWYLHGGPTDARGRLRPTRGGLRVADADMTALLEAINRAFTAGDPVSSLELFEVRGARIHTADTVGKGRPFLDGPPRGDLNRPARAPRGSGLTHAALLLGGGGLLLPRKDHPPPNDPSRRRFLAGTLLLLGGAGAVGCGSSEDYPPPPCQPIACDPVDSWCPPSGYVCADDVGGAAGVGAGGGDVGGGGGDTTVGGDDTGDNGGDSSGGGG